MKTELIEVDGEVALIIPDEMLERKRLAKGDEVTVTETSRGFEVSSYDEEFAHQMEIARQIMQEDKDLLRKLAEND